jgi:S1-C subfamily serine protease
MPSAATLSAAGTDVEVSNGSVPNVELVAVRPTFGATPGNAGLMLAPLQLPITINQVDPKGPAAASGIVAGDQLVAIDGTSVQGMLPDGAMIAIQNHRAGTVVALGIVHGGVPRTVAVTVGE